MSDSTLSPQNTHARTTASTVLHSMSRSLLFQRRTLWIWLVIGAILLAIIGWSVRSIVEGATKSTMAENLKTILNADVTALNIWLRSQKSNALTMTMDDRVRKMVGQMVMEAEGKPAADLVQSPLLVDLRHEVKPLLDAHGYTGFAVFGRDLRVIAATRDELIGRSDLQLQEGLMDRVFAGDPQVSRPFQSAIMLQTPGGIPRAGLPTMFVAAPVMDIDGKNVIGAFCLRIRPDVDFTRILSVARAGESGETYAFDAQGVLISQSRFDEQLKGIGLITDRDEVCSLLNIEIRDPQVDMTRGRRPMLRRSEQPLTRMAADAVNSDSIVRVDVDGYRDYRGVPVIGAWTWLPEYGFGVATEVDVAEAYLPVYLLRKTFWGLFALVVAAAVAMFVFTVIIAKLNRKARQAAMKAQQLGQYTLEEEIGAGGMGVVYRGHHAMLRRPTAIKLLDIDKTNSQSVARFEREVQLTSKLNHPNTIAIFDYGRTPEGIFYYAMEYLDGIDLNSLVQRYGPQPDGRVISILTQICGSLIEAHGVGLIHRDIKPANIVLNQRGGMHDVVKLLDFGLVKAVDGKQEAALTSAGSLTGTPLYLSPEGIERPDSVDSRSDLYAVGAVGYFILTGTPVFDGQSVVEICMQQVNETPQPPSQRLGAPISSQLEAVLLKCLAKSPADRPAKAKELLEALLACEPVQSWTMADASEWWNSYSGTIDRTSSSPTDPSVAAAETMFLESGDPSQS